MLIRIRIVEMIKLSGTENTQLTELEGLIVLPAPKNGEYEVTNGAYANPVVTTEITASTVIIDNSFLISPPPRIGLLLNCTVPIETLREQIR